MAKGKLRFLGTVLLMFATVFANVFASVPVAHAYPFYASQNYAVADLVDNASTYAFNYPVSVHLDDFDGDGDQDAATALYYRGAVSITSNNGQGEFTQYEEFPVGGGPYVLDPNAVAGPTGGPIALTSGDIDGDLDPDIVTANYASDTISVIFNDGSGSFGVSTEYAAPGGPYAVGLRDIDDDGDLDLFVPQSLSPYNVLTFENDGNGSFSASTTYANGRGPRSIEFADVNGDGSDDFITADPSPASVSVYLANGDGTYATGTPYAVPGSAPLKTRIGDIDGDTDLDIITSGTTDATVVVFKNNGDGTFAAAVSYDVSARNSNWLALSDLDADGDLDVTLVTGYDYIQTAFNDGTGAFTVGAEYISQRSTNSIQSDDLDGDGDMDIITTGGLSDNIAVYLNNGDGTFPGADLIDPDFNPPNAYQSSVLSGDFNGDGIDDIILGTYSAFDGMNVFLGNGDQTFQPVQQYPTMEEMTRPTPVDVDGDGDLDVVFTYNYDNTATRFGVYFNDGDGTFSGLTRYTVSDYVPTSFGTWGLDIADFDEDGDPDIGLTEDEAGTVVTFRNDGTGIFTRSDLITVGDYAYGMAFADYDGDGDLDIAATVDVLPDAAYEYRVRMLLNDGSGNYALANPSTDFVLGTDFPWDVDTDDVDVDGSPDLIVVGYYSNSVYTLTGNGDGTFASGNRYETGYWPEEMSLADIDNDGDLDIGISTYAFDSSSVLINNGDGTFQESRNYFTGRRPYDIAFGDFDGNGSMDMTTADIEPDPYGLSVVWSLLDINPPVLDSISPQDARVGDDDLEITVTGDEFNVASQVRFDGVAIPTTFVSSTRLLATVPSSTFAVMHASDVDVLNPGMDGGTSTAIIFTVADPPRYPTGKGPQYVASADFDGDGHLDVVTVNGGTFPRDNDMTFMFGDGTGQVFRRRDIPTGNDPQGVVAADFDEDGDVDLAVSEFAAGLVTIFENDGTGVFTSSTDMAAGEGPFYPTVVDLDDDGNLDLIVPNYGTVTGGVSVFLGHGDGTFDARVLYSASNFTEEVQAVDLDEDGNLDLAVLLDSSDDRYFGVMIGNGDGTLQAIQYYGTGGDGFGRGGGLAVRDFNQDGHLDAVVSQYIHTGDPGRILLFLGDGSGSFAEPDIINDTFHWPTRGVSEDFNDDGFWDVIVSSPSGTAFLPGNGDGTFGALSIRSSDPYGTLATGDFDEDGNLDVLSASYSAQTFSFLLNDTEVPIPAPTSLAPSSATAGGTGFTLTVDGTGFTPSSTVLFNGIERTTVFVTSTQLTAQVLSSDISSAGTYPVRVHTYAWIGGGTSTVLAFTVNAAPSGGGGLSSGSGGGGGGGSVAPVLSNIRAENVASSSASILWNTNEPANSVVEYGISTAYASGTITDATLVTSHLINLISLSPGTLYHFRVLSRNAATQFAQSTDFTFVTAGPSSQAPDTTPPATPSNFDAAGRTGSIQLTWNLPPDPDLSRVQVMRRSDRFPNAISDGTLVYSGRATSFDDTSVTPGTTYFYAIFAVDQTGNVSPAATDTAAATAPPPPEPEPQPQLESPTPPPEPEPQEPTATNPNQPTGGETPSGSGSEAEAGSDPSPSVGSGSSASEPIPSTSASIPETSTSTPSGDVIFIAPQFYDADGTPLQRDASGALEAKGGENVLVVVPAEGLDAEADRAYVTVGSASYDLIRSSDGRSFRGSFPVPEAGTYPVSVAMTFKEGGAAVSDFTFASVARTEAPEEDLQTEPTSTSSNPDASSAFTVSGASSTGIVLAAIADTASDVASFLQQPEVQQATESVVAPTLLGVGVVNAAAALPAATSLPLLQYLFLQPLLLIGRRRKKKWGVVYNSLTKQPIELAIVRLLDNKTGAVVQTTVTDKLGRYAFSAKPGTYRLEMAKPGYVFPTQYLKDQPQDVAFVDLYHGTPVELGEDGFVNANIPIDPVVAEEAPKSILFKQALRSLQQNLALLTVIGSIIALVIVPGLQTALIALAQVGVYLLFRHLGAPKAAKEWGIAHDAETNTPLDNVIVRIFDKKFNKLLETKVTDKNGKYGFFVRRNVYYVTAEKEGYEKYVSPDIDLTDTDEAVVDQALSMKKVIHNKEAST